MLFFKQDDTAIGWWITPYWQQ